MGMTTLQYHAHVNKVNEQLRKWDYKTEIDHTESLILEDSAIDIESAQYENLHVQCCLHGDFAVAHKSNRPNVKCGFGGYRYYQCNTLEDVHARLKELCK